MPREMIKNVVSEWMAAQTDDNNKTRSLLDATQQISLKQPFMHGLILIPYPCRNSKISIPVGGRRGLIVLAMILPTVDKYRRK